MNILKRQLLENLKIASNFTDLNPLLFKDTNEIVRFRERCSNFEMFYNYEKSLIRYKTKKCGPDKKYWDFVPSESYYIKRLLEAHRICKKLNGTTSFLDVGCGIGNILKIAKLLYVNRVRGIERSKILSKKAKLSGHNLEIITKDALHCDFLYNKSNLIYLYRPIDDRDLLTKLFNIININANVGTVVVANLCEHEASVGLGVGWTNINSIFIKVEG